MAKDLSAVIKKVTGKGAGTYFYIRDSAKEEKNKTQRVNAVTLGNLIKREEDAETKGRKVLNLNDWLIALSMPFDLFLTHCEEEKISFADAYTYMKSEVATRVAAAPVKKTDAQKLASILISLAPNLSGRELAAKLVGMLEDEKGNAVGIVEDKAKTNGRDENGWIYTTTQAQRDKKKA